MKPTDYSPEEREYKYRLHYLLRQLSVEEYEIAMKFFPKKLKVSKSTWKRWIYLKQHQFAEMPAGAAYLFCNFFQIQPWEIFTTPPELLDRAQLLTFFHAN